jgi:DNA-binding IscR family transcriptional regulator
MSAKDSSDRDIVDRLRDSQPKGTTGGYLLNDAADEIVKLRQKIATMSKALTYCAEHARPSIVQDVARDGLKS